MIVNLWPCSFFKASTTSCIRSSRSRTFILVMETVSLLSESGSPALCLRLPLSLIGGSHLVGETSPFLSPEEWTLNQHLVPVHHAFGTSSGAEQQRFWRIACRATYSDTMFCRVGWLMWHDGAMWVKVGGDKGGGLAVLSRWHSSCAMYQTLTHLGLR